MHQDRDTGQSFAEQYAAASGIDPKFLRSQDGSLQVSPENLRAAISRTDAQPLTQELLVERHNLDPEDPEVSSLIGRILSLRDDARFKNFIHAIADNHVAKFKLSRQNGNGQTPIEQPE